MSIIILQLALQMQHWLSPLRILSAIITTTTTTNELEQPACTSCSIPPWGHLPPDPTTLQANCDNPLT